MNELSEQEINGIAANTGPSEPPPITKDKAQLAIVAPSGGLVPQNFEGLWRMATIMAASGMMPKGLEKPEAVFVAVQMGLEVGLSPMSAVQNIAVINGRPSVWGDAGIALVEASGLLENFRETIEEKNGKLIATCFAKRKGRPDPVERTFSQDDAIRADLWGNKSKTPWIQYPKRMLQMRARWWVLKDLFADVLKGLRPAEEMYDIDLEPKEDGVYGMPETQEKAHPQPAVRQGDTEYIFWNLKKKGWDEYLSNLSRDEVESWPMPMVEAFAQKHKAMGTTWPLSEPAADPPPFEPEPQGYQAVYNDLVTTLKPHGFMWVDHLKKYLACIEDDAERESELRAIADLERPDRFLAEWFNNLSEEEKDELEEIPLKRGK